MSGKLNHLPGSDKVHLYNAINLWIGNIVIRQRVEDLRLGIKSYQTKLNVTEPRWDALDFLFKENYIIVSKPRAVIYKDRNDQKKMLMENEVHKFSDGTLTRVLHKLDHIVKDFRLFQYNSGIENRIWSEDDKRRSEEFMENEQNDVESDDERVALANLKLDVDENKKTQKQLKKGNTTLAQELKECKAILAETKPGFDPGTCGLWAGEQHRRSLLGWPRTIAAKSSGNLKMSGNEDHHRQGRRFTAGGNGHDGRDPHDVKIERLRQRVRELEVNGLIQMARRVFDYRIRRIADEATKKMVPTHVLVEIASTITVDPPTEATRRWIVTHGISLRSKDSGDESEKGSESSSCNGR
nr:reverse transcriptase domain-containing protein [Tanacetum cinerariifolium]